MSVSELLEQVQGLDSADQLLLLERIAGMIRHQADSIPKRSILELQGLGKEIWQNVDAQEYVNQERESWNG